MVSATLLYANEVDGSFANSLTTSATPNPQPGPSPAPPNHSSSPTRPSRGSPDTSRSGRLRDGGPDDSEGDGDNDSSTGLGQPVPGEHADMPGVDPWQYPGDSPGEGSGQHGQRNPTMHDYAVHELAATAAEACAPAWPDASANLRHYLENTGTPPRGSTSMACYMIFPAYTMDRRRTPRLWRGKQWRTRRPRERPDR